MASKKLKEIKVNRDWCKGCGICVHFCPKQVLELSGQRYLTGPVVFVRFNMEGEYVSLTMGDLHCIQEYLEQHSAALMADGKNLNCICLD